MRQALCAGILSLLTFSVAMAETDSIDPALSGMAAGDCTVVVAIASKTGRWPARTCQATFKLTADATGGGGNPPAGGGGAVTATYKGTAGGKQLTLNMTGPANNLVVASGSYGTEALTGKANARGRLLGFTSAGLATVVMAGQNVVEGEITWGPAADGRLSRVHQIRVPVDPGSPGSTPIRDVVLTLQRQPAVLASTQGEAMGPLARISHQHRAAAPPTVSS